MQTHVVQGLTVISKAIRHLENNQLKYALTFGLHLHKQTNPVWIKAYELQVPRRSHVVGISDGPSIDDFHSSDRGKVKVTTYSISPHLVSTLSLQSPKRSGQNFYSSECRFVQPRLGGRWQNQIVIGLCKALTRRSDIPAEGTCKNFSSLRKPYQLFLSGQWEEVLKLGRPPHSPVLLRLDCAHNSHGDLTKCRF